MSKHIKNVVVFTVGVIGGFSLCGDFVIKKILSYDDCREFLIKKLATQITDFLYEDTKYHENSRGIYSNCSRGNGGINKKYYVEEFAFKSRGEAMSALEAMKKVIDEYGAVSIADYYDSCNDWKSDAVEEYEADKFGWVTLKDAKVVRNREGYRLSLPIPVEL